MRWPSSVPSASVKLHPLALLPFVIGPYARRRPRQCVALISGERRERLHHRGLRHFERRHRPRDNAIEALRVLEHRRVAARAHVLDDRGDRGIDVRILRGFERDERVERRRETGFRRVETAHERVAA